MFLQIESAQGRELKHQEFSADKNIMSIINQNFNIKHCNLSKEMLTRRTGEMMPLRSRGHKLNASRNFGCISLTLNYD